MNNEKDKNKYLEDKLALIKEDLQKQKNKTGAFEVFEISKLYRIVREKKKNITNQLTLQRQKANATIIEKSNEILKKNRDNLDLKDSYKRKSLKLIATCKIKKTKNKQ